jgi:hypothetical protein
VLNLLFPHLYSFAKQKDIIVASVLALDESHELFHLQLSEEAYDQFCELHVILQSFPTNGGKDSWSYIWGNGEYSSRKAYKHLIGTQTIHPTFGWIWKSKCQMKQKVFFWLLLQNRLNTRAILRRRNMALDSYSCELSLRQVEEMNRHMFFRCSFAKKMLDAD